MSVNEMLQRKISQCSTVNKETTYGLDEQGMDRNFVFSSVSRTALVATQPHNLCPPGTLSLEGKASRALS
jgi:hypothetical protein